MPLYQPSLLIYLIILIIIYAEVLKKLQFTTTHTQVVLTIDNLEGDIIENVQFTTMSVAEVLEKYAVYTELLSLLFVINLFIEH
ncbi:hypothetical protein AB1K91_18705 [Terribacillus sp. 179-K 1B1 HS]|uniref:hypothetical protein n=1 Tax=Terribacillus sp. 179-K 1B1 HS TaxID=3142388 RepID=UPI0039A10CFD